MINYIYQLVNPQFISVKYEDTNIDGKVLVRPKYMSICQADQRYYLGNRDLKTLSKKLPMALIHECCGEVLQDKSGTFKQGDRVVLIPNVPGPECEGIYENYRNGSKFLSSGYDGFMCEFVAMHPRQLVAVPDIPYQTATMCELFSVALHAVKRLDLAAHKHRDTIGIWGDGSMAFMIACAVKAKMPKSRIVVVGRNARKLSRFSFVSETYLTYTVPAGLCIDHAFECAGGEGCYDAIRDIIAHIKPQGTIGLLGVSENYVSIDTRNILEKGLTLVGSSRSGRAEFLEAAQLMKTQRIRRRLGTIIHEDEPVKSIEDIHRVFATDLNTPFKTVFEWRL
ncbi:MULTISPECIES: alcohol dehydrogenase catalytic domain-containing protein [unclassified Ruminococcus]|uniref:alcohol dehydrogenase catalytic domain-containing protein n=1 Tax=unclassified Ruminococcus TaxID=2608920 RepID=UPI00210BFCF2|nr:alcohol dehydrogenase catalytic domain-containing protein [Ruminococcus sp. zg-924]MCQ4115400.1 alcohol dehydrogenase catalytic domain-containing protein [Ruminococcus sp. zg-921]